MRLHQCIASGNPIPQVVWHIYDHLPIPDHIARYRIGDYVTRDSLLVSYVNISSVLPEGNFLAMLGVLSLASSLDGGLYTCTATNDVASVRHSARINVFGKPSVRRMANMTAVAGESISVTCPVGGYPVDILLWERGEYFFRYTDADFSMNGLNRWSPSSLQPPTESLPERHPYYKRA